MRELEVDCVAQTSRLTSLTVPQLAREDVLTSQVILKLLFRKILPAFSCRLHFPHLPGIAMAEAFGIAAGIVGLASLGVQLTDTIAKLKDARRTYKDAPDDVEALIAALEVLNRILTHICPPNQQFLTAQPQDQLLEDCKSWCQNIRSGIFDILQECRSDILSQPRLGKAKYVFRKGGIDQLLHRLQRAKLDLLLAHQIYGRQGPR
jgi:hypothetical protein